MISLQLLVGSLQSAVFRNGANCKLNPIAIGTAQLNYSLSLFR